MRNPTPTCVRCGAPLDDPKLEHCAACLELVRDAISALCDYLAATLALERRTRME